jgi:hypothetical protein
MKVCRVCVFLCSVHVCMYVCVCVCVCVYPSNHNACKMGENNTYFQRSALEVKREV